MTRTNAAEQTTSTSDGRSHRNRAVAAVLALLTLVSLVGLAARPAAAEPAGSPTNVGWRCSTGLSYVHFSLRIHPQVGYDQQYTVPRVHLYSATSRSWVYDSGFLAPQWAGAMDPARGLYLRTGSWDGGYITFTGDHQVAMLVQVYRWTGSGYALEQFWVTDPYQENGLRTVRQSGYWCSV